MVVLWFAGKWFLRTPLGASLQARLSEYLRNQFAAIGRRLEAGLQLLNGTHPISGTAWYTNKYLVRALVGIVGLCLFAAFALNDPAAAPSPPAEGRLAPAVTAAQPQTGTAGATAATTARTDGAVEEEVAHPADLGTPGGLVAGSDGLPCRQGDLLAGVYHPARLQVVRRCVRVSGRVTAVRHEQDGDDQIDLLPDAPYIDLINETNRQRKNGALVVEVIAADRERVTVPQVGSRVEVVGAYVLDRDHGNWAEIHPAWSIAVVSGDTTAGVGVSSGAGGSANTAPAAANQSPAYTVPGKITAICNDGTHSYSAHRSGTCSHHHGVNQWVNRPAS